MAECILVGNGGGGGGGDISYDEMPYTVELAGLFEPDSLDTANSLWRNKITGGNDMALVGGAVSDNALLFTANEYGCVPTDYYYSCYLVVKKPVLEINKALFGSADGSNDKPTMECWNNGDSKGSFFECITDSSDFHLYYTTNELENYHVVSCSVIDNPSKLSKNYYHSAEAIWLVDNSLVGTTPFYKDVTGEKAYTKFNGVIAINTYAKGNAGSINYTNGVCQQNSYYRALAFGGKQTFEQMQANHKYLYERYCT